MITMTEETPIAAIPIGEWIHKGNPKDTWFRIVYQSSFNVVGRDEIDLCIKLVKATLKSYGKYEMREPVVPLSLFYDIDKYFLGACDILEGGKYIVTVFTEARIIE